MRFVSERTIILANWNKGGTKVKEKESRANDGSFVFGLEEKD